jgi:hypothetical protein
MHDMMHGHTHERPTFHGMVLFGEQTAYLSHLPMFMSLHDYQAVFEVALSKEGTDPLAGYQEDRRSHPEARMYSFAPIIDPEDQDPLTDAFVLSDLVTPANPHDPQSPPLRSAFKGNIFRGHFETFHEHEKAESDPPQPIPGLESVTAHVVNTVVFRKFDPRSQELPQLEYLLFGKAQELFLAHVISGPPDYDQILGVQVEGHQFTDNELRGGTLVTFPGRENSADQKLEEQEEVEGQAQVPAESPDGPHSVAVRIKAGTQFYFETDDLASKM